MLQPFIFSHDEHAPTLKLTPADAQVDFEVVPLREHGDHQEVVEVDALHQQPVAVGHDAVLHHHHGDAATNRRLREKQGEFLLRVL